MSLKQARSRCSRVSIIALALLMLYAASLADSFRQVGVTVDRILKGEKPEN